MMTRLQTLALGAAAMHFFTCAASAVEVLIPSYFYPSGMNDPWTQLSAAAPNVAITAILNPASGPGAAVDANYRVAVNSLRSNGGRVIGYVSTAYAARPANEVKADIAKYNSLYSLDGIFLDELTNSDDAAAIAYYRDIYGYIKALNPDWRVTGNPGTNTRPAYLATPASADTLVTFESNTGYVQSTPSAWTSGYATRRFSNLPYQVSSSATMVANVNAAVAKRAGYIYVTDDGADGNPWDRLPTYWSAELAAIRAVTATWSNATSGDWNRAEAWTTGVAPNGVGAEALLFGAITTPQTIFQNNNLILGVLAINNANRYVLNGAGTLTLDASVEGALIDVRRGSHTINLPLTLKDPTTAYVAAGSTLTIADPLTIAAGASLTKAGPGVLLITATAINNAAAVSVTAGSLVLGSDVTLGSLSLSESGSLDVGDATLRLEEATLDQVRTQIARAYAAGSWSGNGLRSTAVDGRHAIGFVQADGGATLVRLAMIGDTNLDATVGLDDLMRVAAHVGEVANATWADGDFDYDGRVSAADVVILAAVYPGDFTSDWQLAVSLVPEPGLLVLSFAAPSFLRQRRR